MTPKNKGHQSKHQTGISIYRYPYEIGIIIVAIIALIVLSYGITSPWSRFDEGMNGSIYSQYANNYIQYGFIATKFGQIGDSVPLSPEKFKFYVNHPPKSLSHHPFLEIAESNKFSFYPDHPPLLPIIISLFFRIFGKHEWSARLVPILFSTVSIYLIFLLGKQIWNKRAGLIAAIAFAANPMFLYYGHMVDHEALITFFVLLSVLLYLKWLEGDNRYLWALCASIFFGGLTGWPVYYLVAIFGLHYLVFVKKKNLLAIAPAFAALIALTLFYLQLRWFGGGYLRALRDQFLILSHSSFPSQYKQVSLSIMLNRLVTRAITLFTIPLFLAGFTGLLASLYDSYKKRRDSEAFILIGLFVFALIHVLLFRQWAMIHEYWIYYFLIPLSLSMGGSLDFIGSYIPGKIAPVPALIIFIIMIPLVISGTKLMYDNTDYSFAYLGQAISRVSTPGDTVLTSPPAREFYANGPQLSYYARCNIRGSINNVEDFKKALDQEPRATVMVVFSRVTDPKLQKYLYDHYPYTKGLSGKLVFFKLRKSSQLKKAQ